MVCRRFFGWILVLATLTTPCLAPAAGIQALFDLGAPPGGPFPTDRFTLPDPSHNTGLRINLPMPAECASVPAPRPSACSDVETLNTLDGFNLQPRISIPFSGPIDVSTVTSETVFLLDMGGRRIGIDQVVWDPSTTTLHVESDEMLHQHTSYILIASRSVRDTNGRRIKRSSAFFRFLKQRGDGDADCKRDDRDARNNDDDDDDDDKHGSCKDDDPADALAAYRNAIRQGVRVARHAGIKNKDIGVASVFTTQSITAILEKIRDQIKASTPAPANFFLSGDSEPRTVFPVSSIRDIQFRRQVKIVPLELNLAPAPRLQLLAGVSQIAFGKFISPSYLTADRSFTPVGTRSGVPVVHGTEEVYFNLFLPAGTAPPGGWPVVIHGPGTPDNKNTGAYNVAAAAAARGMAVIAINGPGVGFGPASTLTVIPQTGAAVTFSAGGRSIDENGDGLIGSGVAPTSEGDESLPRGSFIARRDVMRQAAVDTMALVRLIEAGMDVDGDGVRDLDPSRIYYQGWSFGAGHGTLFAAVEPNVRVIGLNAAGGGGVDSTRLSPGNRPAVGRFLAQRVPSALNGPGISAFAGVATSAPLFNENMPLRNGLPLDVVLSDGVSRTIHSPIVSPVAGSMEIQRIIDYTQWALQANDAAAYAHHLRTSPLDGVPAKSVIVQMNRGDQTVPNTATTAIVRAGDLADRTMLYRHDLAGQALKNPHTTFTLTNDVAMRSTARAQQDQLAILFESDGALFVDPDDYMVPAPSQPLFEAPIMGPLPEDLGFIP